MHTFQTTKKLVIAFLLLATMVASCKKENTNGGNSTSELDKKLTSNLNVLHNAASAYSVEFEKSGDTLAAFDTLRTRLAQNNGVSGGWFHNTEFLEIEFSNGLKCPITIIPVSEGGEHLRRGGGLANDLTGFRFKKEETKAIKNKKVLVLIPYPDEFKYSSQDIKNLETTIENGQPDMEADILTGSAVTLQKLNELSNYGFIILDVHGVKYGFNLAYLNKEYKPTDVWFPEDVIADIFNVHSIPPDKVANGEIEIGLEIWLNYDGKVQFKFTVIITEEYIRQLNIDLSDAVVFGNHCYSGHTADGQKENNLPQAWKSKGLATYYGYAYDNQVSIPVDNTFCKDMEQLLIKGLITDGDSTGAAHLKADGTSPYYDSRRGYQPSRAALLTPTKRHTSRSLFLIQYFEPNYAYSKCGDQTFTDIRDSETYKIIEIGGKKWFGENLRYSGAIPEVKGREAWSAILNGGNPTSEPAWCYYDNDEAYNDRYGKLYNWYALSSGNLCPTGWHIPSMAEWQEAIDSLGGYDSAGGRLKAFDHWNQPNVDATDEVCFSAYPGGIRQGTGNFAYFGVGASWWSKTERPNHTAVNFAVNNLTGSITPDVNYKNAAFSCRCVED
jgi:uncharacterized protein (TIGR02145 family)